MSGIYLPADYGTAVFVNGKAYHRTGTSPVLVPDGSEMTRIGADDITQLTSYTWKYDDDNVYSGSNHLTWTACEMAACNIHGCADKESGHPQFISAADLITKYEGTCTYYGTVTTNLGATGGLGTASNTTRQTWTAPCDGTLRAWCINFNEQQDPKSNWVLKAVAVYDSTGKECLYQRGLLVNGNFVIDLPKGYVESRCVRVSAGDVVSYGTEQDKVLMQGKAGDGGTITLTGGTIANFSWNGIFLPDSY